MRVVETTNSKLVATESHRASRMIAVTLAALIVVLGIYQASLGNVIAGLVFAAAALAGSYSLCRVLGPVRAVFDRDAGTLSVERLCFYGNRSENHPLSEVASVDIADKATDDRRPQHIVAVKADGQVSLTGPYSNSATHDGVVAQINAWLDSDKTTA